MTHFLNTRNFYKIWFSLNPDCFLTVENQYRFIQSVVANPDAKFTFVYDSSLLSEGACAELQAFCLKLNIRPFDISQDLERLLATQLERNIYRIAKAEIDKAKHKQGGNLGAASDCIRLLSGVIEQGGIYSDFDVQLKFASLDSTIEVKSPVLLPASYEVDEKGLKYYSLNNEVLAFATNEPDSNKLSKPAYKILNALQEEVLKRYVKPPYAFFGQLLQMPTYVAMEKALRGQIKDYFDEHKKSSIFNVRQWIESISLDPEIQTKLYQASVELVSGPYVMLAAFKQALPEFNLFKAMRTQAPEATKPFVEQLDALSFKGNGLHEYVIGQDHQAFGQEECDISWTPQGAEKLAKRSNELLSAILIIQRTFRKHHSKPLRGPMPAEEPAQVTETPKEGKPIIN